MAQTKIEMTPEAVASALTEMRVGAGLSQAELGERLGKYQAWVQRRESGQSHLRIDEIQAWALACGLESELVSRPQGASPPEGGIPEELNLLINLWPRLPDILRKAKLLEWRILRENLEQLVSEDNR